MPSAAHWIVLGDIHDDLQYLEEIPDLDQASGIIVTGDLTFLGGVAAGSKIIDALAVHSPHIYAQIGNMDKPELTAYLEEKGINLHGRARGLYPGLVLIGVGGSSKTPFNTPSEFSEEELGALLEKALAEAGQAEHLVLVTHTPPLNTACDRLDNGTHVGSPAVRAFIEKRQPALCLCGHIHESRGQDRIGDSLIVNPGQFGNGGYAIMALEPDPAGGKARLSAGLCCAREYCTINCPLPKN
ncbi:MAG: metallophosphoesterase family protein [Deltaproteobacteria bacterium]|jgi:Icc-related predicted phosphoesterase|nr:metallophosphoesterase family protein [Deltaproteobacteria bacterium]